MARNRRNAIRSEVVIAIVGAATAIAAAFISYSEGKEAILIPIRTTQTAEAKLPSIIQTVLIIQAPTPADTPTLTGILQHPIDDMDELSNWGTDFCDDQCSQPYGTSSSSLFISLAPGKTNNAIEILYDLRNSGWVLMKKNIDPQVLSGTRGISFSYKRDGAPSTIEFKLLLRYPGDAEDTTFGALLDGSTDTSDSWILFKGLYGQDIKCWWPAELCQKHGHTMDLTAVNRIEFGVSNKPGDTVGLGKVAFDELAGIP